MLDRIGEYSQSLQCYGEVIGSRTLPDYSWEAGQVHRRMGVSYIATNDPVNAFNSYSNAIKVFERCQVRRTEEHYRELLSSYEGIFYLADNSTTIDMAVLCSKIAHTLINLKDYGGARTMYTKSLTIQKQKRQADPYIVALTLHNLGNCLYDLGKLDEAAASMEEALQLIEAIPDVDSSVIGDTYHCIALVYQAKAEYQESLRMHNHALKHRRKARGTEDFKIVSTLYNMSVVLHALGMYEASIKRCGEALKLQKGEQNLVTSDLVACLGLNHRDKGELETSLKCFRESLKNRELILGKDDIIVGRTLRELASICEIRGEVEKEKKLVEQAIWIYERHICSRDKEDSEYFDKAARPPFIEGALIDLPNKLQRYLRSQDSKNLIVAAENVFIFGSLLDRRNRSTEAMECYEFCLHLFHEKLDPKHVTLADLYHRMGCLQFKLGNHDEAIARLLEALNIRKEKLSDTHPDVETTLRMLGQVYSILRQTVHSLRCFNEAIKAKRSRKFTKSRPDDEIDTLLRMGKLHLEESDFDEALACFRDCFKLQTKSRNKDEQKRLAEIFQLLGSVLFEKGDVKESRSCLLSSRQILHKWDGHEKDDILWQVEFTLVSYNMVFSPLCACCLEAKN